MTTKLTKALIDAAAPADREIVLWDASLPGFGVRIKPSGTRSFVIQYRNRFGRSRRVTIGRYGTITLDEARKEARQQLSAVHQGRDPRDEKDRDRAGCSVRALAERYMADHCEGRCKASTMAAHRWLLDRFILPQLGTRSIHEVRQVDIDRLHQSLKATPYNANRALGLLKAMYGRAEVWGLVEPGINPARSVRPFRERKRQRFLSLPELQRLAQALDEAEAVGEISEPVALAYRLLVLTGARLNEIRTLRWEQIDWTLRLIVLRDHKADAGGAKGIPLNSGALSLLTEAERDPDNPYVIAGLVPGAPIADLQRPWRRVRQRAGLDDVRIHDLRHSFASFGISVGASLPIVGGLLGHRSMAATATYAHLAADPLHTASERIGALIGPTLGVASNTPSGKRR